MDAYYLGGIKTDDATGWVIGSQNTTVITRAKLANKTGGDLIVTVGKTLIISYLVWSSASATVYPILMYDDDGAGTNEKNVVTCFGSSTYPVNIPCYIEIPAGKYVTVKSSSNGTRVYIMINGFER